MAKVRGSAIQTRIAFVRDKYGDEGWKRLGTVLSPATRALAAAPIDPRSWAPFEAFVDINVRADALFGRGDYRLCETMGAYGADKNMTTLYRLFFRLGSVTFIMEKAAALWSEHYDAGKLTSRSVDRRHLALAIEDFPTPHCAHCFSVAGWAARTVELTGAKLDEHHRTSCRLWGNPTCGFALRLG